MRIGHFAISDQCLNSPEAAVRSVFAGMHVIATIEYPEIEVTRYTATGDMFEEVFEYDLIPEYIVLITKDGDVYSAKFKREPKTIIKEQRFREILNRINRDLKIENTSSYPNAGIQ